MAFLVCFVKEMTLNLNHTAVEWKITYLKLTMFRYQYQLL